MRLEMTELFQALSRPGVWAMVQAERLMAWIERKIGVAP